MTSSILHSAHRVITNMDAAIIVVGSDGPLLLPMVPVCRSCRKLIRAREHQSPCTVMHACRLGTPLPRAPHWSLRRRDRSSRACRELSRARGRLRMFALGHGMTASSGVTYIMWMCKIKSIRGSTQLGRDTNLLVPPRCCLYLLFV